MLKRSFFANAFAICLTFFSTLTYALPPQAEADKLTIEAHTALQAGDYNTAVNKLEQAKNLKAKLPNTFPYHYGRALIETKNYKSGIKQLDIYISTAGQNGKFYKQALELYTKAENEVEKERLAREKADKEAEKKAEKERIAKQQLEKETKEKAEGLAPINIQGKWGYIDKQGNIVISPQFISASSFSEGLASVQVFVGNGFLYGFIDKAGNFVIKPQFSEAKKFSEGLAFVKMGEKWAYIDKQARFVIETNKNGSSFHEGLAKVYVANESNTSGKFGFINKQGDLIINPQYDYVADFSEGLTAVTINGKDGYIDKKGNFQNNIPINIDYSLNESFKQLQFYSFSEGLAPFCQDWTKCGFIDKQGHNIIKPTFNAAKPFVDGLAAVRVDKKWGFIDKEASMVIGPQFEDAWSFSGNLAMVRVNGMIGYIDKRGNITIPAKFEGAGEFCNGADLILK